MKDYNFTIYGTITVRSSIDDEDLKDELMSSVSMPDCGCQMGVELVELDSFDDDDEEEPSDDDNFNFE